MPGPFDETVTGVTGAVPGSADGFVTGRQEAFDYRFAVVVWGFLLPTATTGGGPQIPDNAPGERNGAYEPVSAIMSQNVISQTLAADCGGERLNGVTRCRRFCALDSDPGGAGNAAGEVSSNEITFTPGG